MCSVGIASRRPRQILSTRYGDNLAGFRLQSLTLAIFVLIAVLSVSCSTSTVQVVEPELGQNVLEFVENGVTSKEDAVNRLGPPSSTFPADEVIIYWMCDQRTSYGEQLRLGKHCLTELGGTRVYNLVLKFESGVLTRHALIRVR
ncbi:MAG: hypothetical protein OEQ39_26130 [Gammaproteobacteria bacterium]|nr:hypothetical protein [Gammaproteobacteria bacterium]